MYIHTSVHAASEYISKMAKINGFQGGHTQSCEPIKVKFHVKDSICVAPCTGCLPLQANTRDIRHVVSQYIHTRTVTEATVRKEMPATCCAAQNYHTHTHIHKLPPAPDILYNNMHILWPFIARQWVRSTLAKSIG